MYRPPDVGNFVIYTAQDTSHFGLSASAPFWYYQGFEGVWPRGTISSEIILGTKKTGKGRRKLGRKKRRMRAKIRHRKK